MSKHKNKTEQNITDDPMINSEISNEPVSQEGGVDAEINGTTDETPASITGQAGVSKGEAESPPQEQIDSLQKELGQVNARLLRVSADYQNYVRRSHQNVANARDEQMIGVAKALVTVLDQFDRAIEVNCDETTTMSLLEGVKIVRDELLHTLERFGVERLEVKSGEEFDPTRHEALMRQTAEDVDANHVVAQLQPGYLLGDKTIRPAQVSVSE